jgi:hypothetical protein
LNSIFIDFHKKEPPNISRYVKNVRNNNKEKDTDSDDSADSDYSKSSKSGDELENEEDNSSIIEDNSEDNLNEIQTLSLKEFKSHVPEWGGNIRLKTKYITLSDTCTIDYYLFSMWIMYKQYSNIIEGLKSFDSRKYDLIKSIITNIESKNWDKAKELWVLKIMNYDISSLDNNNISLFGSEDMMFFQYITNYQEYRLIQKCREKCKRNNSIKRSRSKYIFLNKENNILTLFYGYTKKCVSCGEIISSDIVFTHDPTFLFIEPANQNALIHELPKTIEINGKIFKLLCATIHTELADGHFVGIFNLNDEMLVVDDLNQSVKRLNEYQNNYSKKSVTGSLYVL